MNGTNGTAPASCPDACLALVRFDHKNDNRPKPAAATWPQLAARLTRHETRPEKDGRAWSPAEYLPGTTRGAANVQAVTCFVGDVDDGTAPDALRDRWQGRAWCLYSTHSSAPDKPKWRIVFPLARPVPAADWPGVHRKLTLALLGEHSDPACKDCSRLYYLPSCPPDDLPDAFADVQEGEPLDPDAYPDPDPMDAAGAQMRHALRADDHKMVGANSSSENRHGDTEGVRPGDDYNARGPLLDLLQSAGWQIVGQRGGAAVLRRPGKTSDWSANFGFGEAFGGRMFFCFTSSAPPFEPKTGYSPFAVYTLLKTGGHAPSDFIEAARQLGREGYGDQTPPPAKKAEKYVPPATHQAAPTKIFPEGGFKLTDLGNAERLIHRHGQDLRYNPALGWLVWDGRRWQIDDSGEVMRRAKHTIRQIYAEAATLQQQIAGLPVSGTEGDPNREKAERLSRIASALSEWAKKSEAAPRLAATVELGKTEPGVYVRTDEIDADPWLFNCPNGTIDLNTGALHLHRREDLITKIATVNSNPAAAAPVWEKCLERWQPNSDVRAYLRRATGYSLTGHTGEETAFLLYGMGRNGKSKFTGALEYVAGEYAGRAPIEIFMQGRGGDGNSPTPDKANLAGKRLIVASEIVQSRRFNEAFVKDVTGGDRITAAHKFKAPFEFKPVLKLWLYGNHKPVISGADDGIKARLPLIPFTVTIPVEERDTDLDAKLRAEGEGILAWAVRGALEWRQRRLAPPKAVVEASAAFHEQMDVMAEFFKARCIFGEGKNVWTPTAEMRTELVAWARGEGIEEKELPKPNDFADRLRRHGCDDNGGKTLRHNGKPTRCWSNIRLRRDDDPTPEEEEDKQKQSAPDATDEEQGEKRNTVTPRNAEFGKCPLAASHGELSENGVTGVTGVTEEYETSESGAASAEWDHPDDLTPRANRGPRIISDRG